MEEITGILRRQNHVEEDKVVLVKGRDMLYFKAYSPKMQEEADALNEQMAMHAKGGFYRLILSEHGWRIGFLHQLRRIGHIRKGSRLALQDQQL